MTHKSLYIFDLDETLVTHDASKLTIWIRDKQSKEITGSLDYDWFLSNGFPKLHPNEEFDFNEFSSSRQFEMHSKPIEPVIAIANYFAKQPNHTVVIVTARTDLDDQAMFASTMLKHGIDINKIHVHRAGNGQKQGYNHAKRKKELVRDMMLENGYKLIAMYDDTLENLEEFLDLRHEFPFAHFKAHQVDHKSHKLFWAIYPEEIRSAYNVCNTELLHE
jgi:hypothetical protein